MFSGIVEEVGKVINVIDTYEGRRLKIGARIVTSDMKLGDSISINGACLTVVTFTKDSFEVEATFQTLRITKLSSLSIGSEVNLERALKLSDRLGGHLVTGHIDGQAQVITIKQEGFSSVVTFALDESFKNYFVNKGSVAIDGVSLTVASLGFDTPGKFTFAVALIPHTLQVTTLSKLQVGSIVNIEIDLIAKYVSRLLGQNENQKVNNPGVTLGFLAEHGYT